MVDQRTTLQIRHTLRTLGFSENEIKILTVLCHVKKATAREISQKTTIAFSSVQYSLSNLRVRNLVRTLHGKEDSFESISEQELFHWIDEQKGKHDEIYNKAKQELHGFFSGIHESSWKPEVMYYEGREGIIEIYEDMLKTAEAADKNIYSWIDIAKTYEIVGDYVLDYIERRKRKKIISHDIVPQNEITLKHYKKNKEELREMKFAKNFPMNGDIRIYGDKVAVITFSDKKPVGFVFQGVVITNLFRTIFDNTWENLK